MRKVIFLVHGEIPDDGSLDKGDYRVQITSGQDSAHDLCIADVLIYPNLIMNTTREPPR
jgi:hypothetical protein